MQDKITSTFLSNFLLQIKKKNKKNPAHKAKSSMHSEALKLCAVDHCLLQGDEGDNSMCANNVLNWSAIGCLALPVQVKLEWL